jgi:hypothetical protein
MKRAGFLAGLSATLAAAAACSALVPDLPPPPEGGSPDGSPESAAAVDAPYDVSGGDALVGTTDASDANDGDAPDAGATGAGPTFVQSNFYAAGPATVTTLSSGFTKVQIAGDLLLAMVFVDPGNVSQTPTDTMGNHYHLAKHQTDNGQSDSGHNAFDIYIWYAWNCAAANGSENLVTVSMTGGQWQNLIIEEWTNVVSSADPLDVTGGATSETGAPSCNVTPTGPGVVIAGSGSDNGQTGAGSGWYPRVDTTDGAIAIDQIVTSPGTITPSSTPADGDWTMAAAVFKAR